MLKSSIAPLDREVQMGSFGAIGYDNKSVATRLIMHAAHKPALSMFDYRIACQETSAACKLRVLSGKNSGLPGGIIGPWENLEVYPQTNFWFSALPQPQTTLEAVTSRLYDLSSFDAQQKNPAEVKALLMRWKELTKSPKDRPTFMS